MYKIICIVIFISLMKHAATQEDYVNSSRLTKTFQPLHYELTIQPDIAEFKFNGKVDIKFYAPQTEDTGSNLGRIELNSNGLDIDDYTITLQEDGKNVNLAAWTQNDEFEKFIINPAQPLKQKTEYILHLDFSRNILTPKDDGGLILSSYKTEDGIETYSDYIIANLFPIYARRVFPCFDEPYFKATFNLTLGVPKGFSSISNTPVLSITEGKSTRGENIQWHVFQQTPKMAPSSLSIFISKLSAYKNATTHINTWAPTQEVAASLGEQKWWTFIFKSSITIFTLGTSIHLPEFNYVFIPDLFKPTISSWGVVYIRANVPVYNLKLDNKNLKNLKDLNELRINAAREIASQFYGDTVSPVWWDEVWLRDGISEFEGSFLVTRYEGDIQFQKFMAGHLRPEVLEYESKYGETIVKKINDQKSLEVVKSITQQKRKKGAAVLFMLMNAFSDAVFRPAIFDFLKDGDLSTSTTNNLIKLWQNELDKQTLGLPYNFTAEKIVNSWLKTEGVPVLIVQRREGSANQTLMISQQKLGRNNNDGQYTEEQFDSFDYEWYIPLTYTTKLQKDFESTKAQLWLGPHEVKNHTVHYTLTLDNAVQHDDWIILNNKGTGLYRILYDNYNWKLIANQLKDNVTIINELNRAQIVDDIFALAWDGSLSYIIALRVAEYLNFETAYYPWHAAYNAFKKLNVILLPQNIHKDFIAYIKPLIESAYDKISHGQEDQLWQILLNAETLKWACDLQIGDSIQKATLVMHAILSNNIPRTIPGDYLESAFCGGLQLADIDTWTKVLDFYRKKNDTINEKYLLHALGCSKNKDIIERYSKMIIKPGELNYPEEIEIVFHTIAQRPEHTNVALSLLTTNAKLIEEMYGAKTLTFFILSLREYLTTQSQYEQLSSIKSQNINHVSLLELDKTLEAINSSINWSKTFIPQLESYFYEIQHSTTVSPIVTGSSTGGGSTAGGSTAEGSTPGGSTGGGSTAGGSTAGGSTGGGSTHGSSDSTTHVTPKPSSSVSTVYSFITIMICLIFLISG